MNNEPCIVIHCITLQHEKFLNGYLNDFVKKHWPNAHVLLESSEPYWKEDAKEDTTYGVYSTTKPITVSEFIREMKLTWNYSESFVYDVESKMRCQEEKAIWNKLNHPDEVFFSPMVTWVHIYTW